jgi:hypothetical protein
MLFVMCAGCDDVDAICIESMDRGVRPIFFSGFPTPVGLAALKPSE